MKFAILSSLHIGGGTFFGVMCKAQVSGGSTFTVMLSCRSEHFTCGVGGTFIEGRAVQDHICGLIVGRIAVKCVTPCLQLSASNIAMTARKFSLVLTSRKCGRVLVHPSNACPLVKKLAPLDGHELTRQFYCQKTFTLHLVLAEEKTATQESAAETAR